MKRFDIGSHLQLFCLVAKADLNNLGNYSISKEERRFPLNSNRNPSDVEVPDDADWFQFMNEVTLLIQMDGHILRMKIEDLSGNPHAYLRNYSPRYFLPGAVFIRPFEVEDCAEMPDSVRRSSKQTGAWKGRNGSWSKYEDGDVVLGVGTLVECPDCKTWLSPEDMSSHLTRYNGVERVKSAN